LEICAGGGGQALGIEVAGFDHATLVEIDEHACATLRHNRQYWKVETVDLTGFDATSFRGIDLFAGGIPCPPFSRAGKQLGRDDERDLFPVALRLIEESNPEAVMIENVRGMLDPIFDEYRAEILLRLQKMGYATGWKLFNACEFGVPQNRTRAILVALKKKYSRRFRWPDRTSLVPPTVGLVLEPMMGARGWKGATEWARRAHGIAPTIVGGSKKHGGPDLGPTRAKRAWAELGVDGHGIANDPPDSVFEGSPRLTIPMVARLQGFPDDWHFVGSKTTAYRQVGNALPPPVATALGGAILHALAGTAVQIPRGMRPVLSQTQLASPRLAQTSLF
jgi:DNA (cytosine-5)-methyltransferase 1